MAHYTGKGKVKYGTPTRCNNNRFLLIFKISSIRFGQVFAHLQERKTEIFFTTDGQKLARNMLS
jgi:hypothetical protein